MLVGSYPSTNGYHYAISLSCVIPRDRLTEDEFDMDGNTLDEKYLFGNFDEQHVSKGKSKKGRKRKLSDCTADESSVVELPEDLSKAIEQKDKYIQQLEEQNSKLKSAIKRICGPQSVGEKVGLWEKGYLDLMPMAAVLFLNNDFSVTFQKDIDDAMVNLTSKGLDLKPKATMTQDAKSQPSAVPLRAFAVDAKGKRMHIPKNSTADPHIYSAVHYYIGFCVDRIGLPLLEQNPSISESWNIPVYEQVFLNALPIADDEGRKFFVRQNRTKRCFNCLGDHNVTDCDQPKDQARINLNKQEFMNKFGGSPVSDSRYHQGEQDRFKEFVPGVISESLRGALMISKEELPPYIYKMRDLGYPPAYLKSKNSGLLMYGKEGKIQYGYGEEEGEIQPDTLEQEVLYPGFNAPIEEGLIDRSAEFGLAPFEEYYAAVWSHSNGNNSYDFSTPSYHQNVYHDQTSDDMEVEHAGAPMGNLLSSPIEVYSIGKANQVTSSPLENSSMKNDAFQPPLPDYTPEKAPPPPDHAASSSPLTPSSFTSVEIGELLEKAEMSVKKSKVIDAYLAQSGTSLQLNEDSTHRRWWDQEPLSTTAGILYQTYTPPPTVQKEVALSDIFRYTASDLDREPWKTDSTSWYDPLYGDLSAPTGIYDAIKEILKKRTKKLKKSVSHSL